RARLLCPAAGGGGARGKIHQGCRVSACCIGACNAERKNMTPRPHIAVLWRYGRMFFTRAFTISEPVFYTRAASVSVIAVALCMIAGLAAGQPLAGAAATLGAL